MIEFQKNGRTVRFVSDVGSLYRSHMEKGDFYEDDFLNYTTQLNLPGTYLDVGTNVANHAIYWGMFSKADKVYGFEPINWYREIAKKNLALNGLVEKIDISEHGVGETQQTVELRFQSAANMCEIVRLDDLNFQAPVCLAKFDVEGMEPPALKGALDLLRQEQPVVYCEVIQDINSEIYDDAAVRAVLEPLGYIATGRVFNYQPTVEYVIPESKAASYIATQKRHTLDVTSLIPSHPAVTITPSKNASASILFDDCPRCYVTDAQLDFMKPIADKNVQIDVTGESAVFVEVEAYMDAAVYMAVIVNQYDAETLVSQERFFINRRRFIPLSLNQSAQSIRIILDCKGSGELRLRKMAVSSLA